MNKQINIDTLIKHINQEGDEYISFIDLNTLFIEKIEYSNYIMDHLDYYNELGYLQIPYQDELYSLDELLEEFIIKEFGEEIMISLPKENYSQFVNNEFNNLLGIFNKFKYEKILDKLREWCNEKQIPMDK